MYTSGHGMYPRGEASEVCICSPGLCTLEAECCKPHAFAKVRARPEDGESPLALTATTAVELPVKLTTTLQLRRHFPPCPYSPSTHGVTDRHQTLPRGPRPPLPLQRLMFVLLPPQPRRLCLCQPLSSDRSRRPTFRGSMTLKASHPGRGFGIPQYRGRRPEGPHERQPV